VAQNFVEHDSDDVHRLYMNAGREALEQVAAALPKLIDPDYV
jgi:hypothetical protein